MTSEQKAFFRENGYLLLRGILDKKQLGPIKAQILDELKRLRVWSSGKTLSASIKALPAFQQITKLSGLIKQDDLHTRLINHATLSTIVGLAETNVVPAQSQFLISLPHQGDWTLDGLSWHTDITAAGHRRVPGIQAFILIDEVKPRGGATLAIAGSHLLADQEDSYKRARGILRRQDSVENALRDNNLSVVEMSGHAGDVYLMDMRLLHTPSINATDKLRLMATIRYFPATSQR